MKIHGGPTMEAGTPDILACIPIRPEGPHSNLIGIFVGIETKMPSGGDPSPIQQHRHMQIGDAYGQVIVPRSVQEAVRALEAMGWHRVPPRRDVASRGT